MSQTQIRGDERIEPVDGDRRRREGAIRPLLDEVVPLFFRGDLGLRGDDVEYRAVVSRDEIGVADERWHLSISGQDDVPPWRVMATIGHDLRPGVPMAMGLPPRSWWINVHPHTLHMWELHDENLIAQWRAERSGHTPT